MHTCMCSLSMQSVFYLNEKFVLNKLMCLHYVFLFRFLEFKFSSFFLMSPNTFSLIVAKGGRWLSRKGTISTLWSTMFTYVCRCICIHIYRNNFNDLPALKAKLKYRSIHISKRIVTIYMFLFSRHWRGNAKIYIFMYLCIYGCTYVCMYVCIYFSLARFALELTVRIRASGVALLTISPCRLI